MTHESRKPTESAANHMRPTAGADESWAERQVILQRGPPPIVHERAGPWERPS
jgi:hypothetical protein